MRQRYSSQIRSMKITEAKWEVNNVNKADLVKSISEKSDLTKADAEKALNAIMESIEEALANGDKVQLVGFGTFEVREKPERKGINPQTKKEITIKASKAPVFRVGKGLKDMVNK